MLICIYSTGINRCKIYNTALSHALYWLLHKLPTRYCYVLPISTEYPFEEFIHCRHCGMRRYKSIFDLYFFFEQFQPILLCRTLKEYKFRSWDIVPNFVLSYLDQTRGLSLKLIFILITGRTALVFGMENNGVFMLNSH